MSTFIAFWKRVHASGPSTISGWGFIASILRCPIERRDGVFRDHFQGKLMHESANVFEDVQSSVALIEGQNICMGRVPTPSIVKSTEFLDDLIVKPYLGISD